MPTEALSHKVEPNPDFRAIDTWIFDLDNTLYQADCNLFAQIDARMTKYIMRLLNLPAGEAKTLQHVYYSRYGTTLSGLMANHGADPDDFLAYVHDIDLSPLVPDLSLNAAVGRLPGRRFVFTNSSSEHSLRVLERIGLAGLIDDIWDIRKSGFTPKPNPAAYERLVLGAAINPKSAAFFEDLARNLVPAHVIGMTTVWINNGSLWAPQGSCFTDGVSEYINHETGDLAGFLQTIGLRHDD